MLSIADEKAEKITTAPSRPAIALVSALPPEEMFTTPAEKLLYQMLKGQATMLAQQSAQIADLLKFKRLFAPETLNKFLTAIKENDAAVIEEILDPEFDINARNSDGDTALMYAVRYGQEALVKRILDNKADVQLKNKQGEDALSMSAKAESIPVIKLLLPLYLKYDEKLSRTVEKQEVAKYLNPVLLAAVKQGDIDLVRQLLASKPKPNVNFKGKEGDTPLLWAVKKGYIEMTSLLLESKADVRIKNKTSKNDALEEAMQGNRRAFAKQLLPYYLEQDPARIFHGNNSLLAKLASQGDLDFLKIILASDAAKQAHPNDLGYAFILAVTKNLTDIMMLLLAHEPKPNLNVKNSFGDTALMWAVENSCAKTVKLLTKNKVNVLVKDSKGRDALSDALNKGSASVVQALVPSYLEQLDGYEIYERIYTVSRVQQSVLMYTLKNDDVETLQIILDDKAANRFLGTSSLAQSLVHAVKNGSVNVVAALLSYAHTRKLDIMCDPENPFYDALCRAMESKHSARKDIIWMLQNPKQATLEHRRSLKAKELRGDAKKETVVAKVLEATPAKNIPRDLANIIADYASLAWGDLLVAEQKERQAKKAYQGVDFRLVDNISKFDFANGDLQDTNFRGVKGERKGFSLNNTRLARADFQYANLTAIPMENCHPQGADFRGAFLPEDSKLPGYLRTGFGKWLRELSPDGDVDKPSEILQKFYLDSHCSGLRSLVRNTRHKKVITQVLQAKPLSQGDAEVVDATLQNFIKSESKKPSAKKDELYKALEHLAIHALMELPKDIAKFMRYLHQTLPGLPKPAEPLPASAPPVGPVYEGLDNDEEAQMRAKFIHEPIHEYKENKSTYSVMPSAPPAEHGEKVIDGARLFPVQPQDFVHSDGEGILVDPFSTAAYASRFNQPANFFTPTPRPTAPALDGVSSSNDFSERLIQ